jgi:hypothetical protein
MCASTEEVRSILAGEIVNPNQGKGTDYYFFIACSIGVPELAKNGHRTVSSIAKDVQAALNQTQWYGEVSCKSGSTIVVPNKYVNVLSPPTKDLFIRKLNLECETDPAGFDISKCLGFNLITSDVSLGQLKALIYQAGYKARFSR